MPKLILLTFVSVLFCILSFIIKRQRCVSTMKEKKEERVFLKDHLPLN